MRQYVREWAARIPEGAISTLLVLASLVVGIFAWVKLDRAYTRHEVSKLRPLVVCGIPDSVLHHAAKPNCAGIIGWGRIVFPYYSNNIGLRDERIRDVPPVVARPRILLLGDSFTEGVHAWPDTYPGMMAAGLPGIELLNGGRSSYSPSNYLNFTKRLLDRGIRFDEVIVFLDVSDIQDEAAYYRDNEETGGVDGPIDTHFESTWYARQRIAIARDYYATDLGLAYLDQLAIRSGLYFKPESDWGNLFDLARSAWTYRPVSDALPYVTGYGPLGLAAGLEKAQRKMSLLRDELARRNIPLSVVVYPWPAQLVHDTVDSRQVTIWRDWCAGRCRRFISLFPDFFAVKEACPWYAPGCWYDHFVFGDVHYNPRGNKVVADAMIRRIRDDPPTKLP